MSAWLVGAAAETSAAPTLGPHIAFDLADDVNVAGEPRDPPPDAGKAAEATDVREEAIGIHSGLSRASVPFEEVVWARVRASDEARRGVYGPWQAECARRLALFESVQGEITEAFWGENEPVAVALTERHPTPLQRFFGGRSVAELHRATEIPVPAEIAVALHEGDLLAAKTAAVSRFESRVLLLRRVLSAQSLLLGLIDEARGDVPRPSSTAGVAEPPVPAEGPPTVEPR